MKHFSLRFKFIIFIAAVLVTIFGLTTYTLVRINTDTLRTNLFNESKAFAALATKPIGDSFVIYKDSGRIRILQEVDKFGDLNPNVTNVAVTDLDGTVLFSQHADRQPKISREQASTFDPLFINDSNGQLARVVYPFFEDFGVHRYSLVYSVSSASINQSISQLVNSILVFSLIGLVISAAVTYALINRLFLKPMRHVSLAATAISQGDLDRQISVERKDEIADLATSVNTMANALKADITKLKEVDKLKSEFMMIASHNLRTPLTVIDGYLEMLQNADISPENLKLVNTVTANSKRLGILAEDILTIAQLDAGQTTSFHAEPVVIRDFFVPIVSEFQPLAEAKRVTFSYQAEGDDRSMAVSKSQLRHAVWNLLDNALKFTPEAGKINLDVRAIDTELEINVSDTGIGIAPEEIPKLFTKFHRSTSTLQYDYEGAGIGLYITKLLVEQHGGQVNVKTELNKGSTFTITLPIGATGTPTTTAADQSQSV